MRRGFTLSEVLITLGVIGIIAAITLPSLVKNYQKNLTVNKLKKELAELNSVVSRASSDYGFAKQWDYPIYDSGSNLSTIDWVEKYIIPYVKTTSGVLSCSRYNNASNECQKFYFYPLGNNSINYPQVIIKVQNGSMWGFSIHPWNNWLMIYVYLNPKKHVLGKDVFVFIINRSDNNPIVKVPDQRTDCTAQRINEQLCKYSREHCLTPQRAGSCAKGGNGGNYLAPGTLCSTIIFNEGWKIPDNYPW